MIKYNEELIQEAKMLEEIRNVLGLTIEDFVYQMDCDYINGRVANFV